MTRPAEATQRAPRALRALQALGRTLLALPAWVRALAALAWMALIFLLSARSFSTGASSGAAWGVSSNLAHPFEYGILALLFALCAPRSAGWPRLDARARKTIVALAFAYAFTDETHQAFVPFRNASVLDLVSDFVGAWLAVRAASFAGGELCDARALARTIAWGIPACCACAVVATWVPEWFPDAAWL